jgi:hypothetical protein
VSRSRNEVYGVIYDVPRYGVDLPKPNGFSIVACRGPAPIERIPRHKSEKRTSPMVSEVVLSKEEELVTTGPAAPHLCGVPRQNVVPPFFAPIHTSLAAGRIIGVSYPYRGARFVLEVESHCLTPSGRFVPSGRIFSLCRGARLGSRSASRRYFFFSFFGPRSMLGTAGHTL